MVNRTFTNAVANLVSERIAPAERARAANAWRMAVRLVGVNLVRSCDA